MKASGVSWCCWGLPLGLGGAESSVDGLPLGLERVILDTCWGLACLRGLPLGLGGTVAGIDSSLDIIRRRCGGGGGEKDGSDLLAGMLIIV
jgi:hypothetical protein